MKNFILHWSVAFFLTLSGGLIAQTTSNFESINLGSKGIWNGSDYSRGFNSGNAKFNNIYDSAFGGTWSGWAVSNLTDSVTPGYMNQYSVSNGIGYSSSEKYAIGYMDNYGLLPTVVLTGAAQGKVVSGCWVNNSTYAYWELKNGSKICKKFGGTTGNDSDYFKLTAQGFLAGTKVLKQVHFMLADYTSTDNSKDYIIKNWTWMDLSGLGNVDSIVFTMTSSDTGSFGMNTPAYFCMDNLITTDIALSIASDDLLENLYIYPNPASDMVYTSIYGNQAQLSIFDMEGRIVLAQNLSENKVDLTNISAGVYVMNITKEGKNYRTKLVRN